MILRWFLTGFLLLVLHLLYATEILADDVQIKSSSPPPLSFDQDNLLLTKANFRLEAKIRLISSQSNDIEEEVFLTEYYSNEQQKARLEFHATRDERYGPLRYTSYYYHHAATGDKKSNSSNNIMLKLGHWISSKIDCQSVEKGEILKDLFGTLAHNNDEMSPEAWFRDWGPEVPDHIVGYSRLVMIARQQVARLRPVDSAGTRMRNMEVKKYELNIDLSTGAVNGPSLNKMMIYFAHSSVHYPNADFPIRIWLVLSSAAEVIVDFSSVEPIHQFDFNLEPETGRDMFSFPIGFKCSRGLHSIMGASGGSNGSDMTRIEKLPRIVSFKADIYERREYSNSRLIDSPFVAYDGYLSALRMESTKRELNLKGQMRSFSMVTTYDVKRNLKFNSRQLLDFTDANVMQQIVADDNSRSSGGGGGGGSDAGSCVASRINEEREYEENSKLKNPLEPIIPFDKMALMGQGRVRGVQVWIFETVSSELPSLIFAKVNYMDPDGDKIASVFKPSIGSLKKRNECSIVYYFAKLDDKDSTAGIYEQVTIKDKNLGQLMQVDVFRDNEDLSYRVEVHQFLWRLTESPGGIKAHELFSLEANCFQVTKNPRDLDPNQNAQLSMELEYLSEEQQTISYVTDTAEMFASPSTRNKAILRLLSGPDSKLYATQVYELESKLRVAKDKSRFSIGVSVKLSNLKPIVYKAISVSRGSVKDQSKKSGARTFDECYWQAAHRTAQLKRPILFTFCLGFCYTSNESPEGMNNSKLFAMAPRGSPCEIMKLDGEKLDRTKRVDWLSLYKNLKSNLFSVPIQKDDAIDGSTREVSLNVKHLSISNDNWLDTSANGTGLSEAATLKPIEGFRFVLEDGVDSDAVKRITKATGGHDIAPMDLRYCRSKCVVDLKCKSFSICITGQGVECASSIVNIRNLTIQRDIKQKTEDLKAKVSNRKSSMRGATIEIVNASDKDGEPFNFKLQLDNRCQIYPKIAREMFISTPRLLQSNVAIENIVPATSLEDCAEFCLQRSVKFFKRSAATKLKYLRSDDRNNDEKLTALMLDNFKYFCSRFKFYNLLTNDVKKETIDLLNENKMGDITGICILAKPNLSVPAKSPPMSNDISQTTVAPPTRTIKLTMEAFDFKFEMLYEKQYNVYLNEGKFLDPIGRELINKQVKRQNPFNVEICARTCFLQKLDSISWCKSFEFVEDQSSIGPNEMMKNNMKTYCIFNTISLAEAKPHENLWTAHGSEMIAKDKLTYWHFEPIDALTLDSKVWFKILQNPSEDLPMQQISNVIGVFRLGAFGILILLVVSIASGLALGIYLGTRIPQTGLIRPRVIRSSSIASQSESILNSIVVAEESAVNSNTFELDASANVTYSKG